MSDFDERLRSRLERLDAAVPDPRPLPVASLAVARVRRRGRRRIVVLLAAAALLLTTSAVTGSRLLFPEEVPYPDIDAALGEIFNSRPCVTAADANPLVRTELDALGYADWGIESRPGADTARCVGAGVDGGHHSVILIPGAGQALSETLQATGEEMLRQCFNRDEAIAFLSSVLTAAGETDFSIDPSSGIKGGPLDQIDAYYEHVAAGCYVYVGVGRDEAGRATYYLWGE